MWRASPDHSLAAETPPSEGEAEVCLFGPGRGEAIAIHLGAGSWMLVDSCLDGDGRPAALAYLERIGCDPSCVELIVCTHWHDDHIGGLSELVAICKNADFAYSGALRNEEFSALVGAYSERTKIKRNGVSEFGFIANNLREQAGRSPKFAIENRALISRASAEPPVTVHALSPCDKAIERSQLALAELLPARNTQKRAVPPPKQNHASVALSVAIGDARLLLGADLEETADGASGWTAVLNNYEFTAPSAVFKVPHHGSGNGDQPQIWDEVLIDNPWAIVTPFVWGRHKLPKDSDRARIRSHTNRAYLTAAPERKRRKRERTVEKTLEQFKAVPVNVDPLMGQIRLRSPIEQADGWTVELFGPAFQLE